MEDQHRISLARIAVVGAGGGLRSWARRGLSLRVGSGVLVGGELAGIRGASACAGAALATAYAGSRLRSQAQSARIAGGVAEDLLSYALIVLATSEQR